MVVEYISTTEQMASIFTKFFPKERFLYLRNKLNMIDIDNINEYKVINNAEK